MSNGQCLIFLRDSADLKLYGWLDFSEIMSKNAWGLFWFNLKLFRVGRKWKYLYLFGNTADNFVIKIIIIYLGISNSQTHIAWVFYSILFYFYLNFFFFGLFPGSVSNPIVQICNSIATIVPFRWNELGGVPFIIRSLLLRRSAPSKPSYDRILSF